MTIPDLKISQEVVDLIVRLSFLLPGLFALWAIVNFERDKKYGPKVSHWLLLSITYSCLFIAYNLLLPWGIFVFISLGGIAGLLALILSFISLIPLWKQNQNRMGILMIYLIPLAIITYFIYALSILGP